MGTIVIEPAAAYLRGHFPGRPILPGVVQLQLLVEHLFQPARAGCKKSVFCAIHEPRLFYRHGGHEVLRRMRKIRLAKDPSRR